MNLDLFDYFWNSYKSFFKKYDCIDDYTLVYITKNNILHLEVIRCKWDSVNFKDSADMIKEFDDLIKELFGNVIRIETKEDKQFHRVIIEYQITDEIKNRLCMLSELKGYKVFEIDESLC